MAVEEFAHVGVVVADLDAVTDFFAELGLEAGETWESSGKWVDGIIGLEGTEARSRMLVAPQGGTCIELTQFDAPESPASEAAAPANAPGLRHITFQVDDLDKTIARLTARGASLIGEVAVYESAFRLCYMRGPEGLIVELAERIS